MGKQGRQQSTKNVGRPPKIDKMVLQKLEHAFSYAFSDREACLYAGIVPQTLYNYQNKNPEFLERKQALKLSPNLKAKQTVVASLGNPADAWKWLEKRDPEFKPAYKIKNIHSGSIETRLITLENMSEGEKQALRALRDVRRKRIEDESDKMD